MNTLQKYLDAQSSSYSQALSEIKNGRKQGHWIWYVFPQIAGLGFSETSKYYAIKDLAEAAAYLNDKLLGQRLIEISTALLNLKSNDALRIFGSPDNLKLRSSMTLFSSLENTPAVFQQVLDKFFNGQPDEKTISILRNQEEKA